MSCSHRRNITRSLRKTLILILLFMLVEFVAGYLANSLALMSDALHMFTDAGAVLLSLFAFWIAKKPPDKKLTYGYHRAEIIAALLSGLSTWAFSGILIYEAIRRLLHEEVVQGPLVLVVAVIGLIANFFMLRLLHKEQKESLNVRGAYLHILGDLFGSIGVIVAGILLLTTHWYPIDPIITLLFSAIIIHSAWKLVKDTLHVLMEGVPSDMDPDRIRKDLESLPAVKGLHDLHLWTLSSGQATLTAHLISDLPAETLTEAHELLKKKYRIRHSTLQIEPEQRYACEICAFHDH